MHAVKVTSDKNREQERRPTREEVLDWIERLVTESIRTAKGESDALSPRYLYNLRQSADLLLDETFRRTYSRVLAQHPGLAEGAVLTLERGGKDLRPWNVDGVLIPTRDRTLATFPIPSVHVGENPANPEDADRTRNIRPRLMWFGMGWHTSYVLVCRRCDCPQGPRGGSDVLNSTVPTIADQVRQLLGPAGFVGEADPHSLHVYADEECWGRASLVLAPAIDRIDRQGLPLSTLAGLFDQALGFSMRSHDPERDSKQYDFVFGRLEPVAQLLKKLQCRSVSCGIMGELRYLPRILMPIDADISPSEQAIRAQRHAERLLEARNRIGSDDSLGQLLWWPPDFPSHELLEIASRFNWILYQAHRLPQNPSGRLWPVAIWAADALRRKKNRRTKGHWRSLIGKERLELHGFDPDDFDSALTEIDDLQAKLVTDWPDLSAPDRASRALSWLSCHEAASSLLSTHYWNRVVKDQLKHLRSRLKRRK